MVPGRGVQEVLGRREEDRTKDIMSDAYHDAGPSQWDRVWDGPRERAYHSGSEQASLEAIVRRR